MNTNKLLELLLSGKDFTTGTLDLLLKEQTKEDQYLEYKHGDELKKANASKEIRKYVSGFANSQGGIYIIGVDEKNFQVTGCTVPGGGDLAEWIARCLNPIAQYFSLPPRFSTLKHPDGDVLIICVDRMLNLISTIDEGEPTYYLRFYDQTLKAPDYLISDTLLGRKAFPYLSVTSCKMVNDRIVDTQYRNNTYDEAYKNLQFELHLRIENEGLVWAEETMIGLISWNVGNKDGSVGQHLLSYLDVTPADVKNNVQPLALHHKRQSYGRPNIMPFSAVNLTISSIEIPILPPLGERYEFVWKAALYLISKNAPPIWYQLNLPINKDPDVRDLKDSLYFERISRTRPVISFSD